MTLTTSDYYHEVGRIAREIAKENLPEARKAVETGDKEETIEAINSEISSAVEFDVFNDELGDLWTVSTTDRDEMMFMAEIIYVSNGRFPDKVEGRPKKAIRRAAGETLRYDIHRGTFRMLRKWLAEDGLIRHR